MQYLTKPRGRGYSLRMATPNALVGTENPWTGKPFGNEIKLGLHTKRHAEAVRMRDVRLGQIRQLEADALANKGKKSIGKIIDLSPESAAEWRRAMDEAEDPSAIDHVLTNELERADEAGRGEEAEAFGKMVFKGAVPLEAALETYLEERKEGNPFGYDPLAVTTALNVRASVKHLMAFLGSETPTLNDVTPDKVFEFRMEYLPLVAKVKAQTVAKHMTLLRGMWAWAISDKKFLKTKNGKPVRNPWIVEERGTPKRKAAKRPPEETRTAFTAEEVTKLLQGFPAWGSRQGDLLRLALASGCRIDEVGALKLQHVKQDGSGFMIAKGKTASARRYVPLVEEAQRLLAYRVELATRKEEGKPREERRLFPEWPLKPSTQKVNAASQWFTRYRRQVLGSASDGRLVLHSFRHTWGTLARRAGVPEDRRYELGGWVGKQDAASVYEHGLLEAQLQEVQRDVWAEFRANGYLEAF
ncbi:tyrosine-type recombinase/integrase [Roseovarius sp. A46]|uniref:tyrosine-type recombinase/integrase n=1 Tax=Roseovarius sp. A46 TaxID=2109331 RepID=UPI0013E98002|nr:tyrosine-type recombinase/integrase [Roseovarius sp. A46]